MIRALVLATLCCWSACRSSTERTLDNPDLATGPADLGMSPDGSQPDECGGLCGANQVCDSGKCVEACDASETLCGQSCRDLDHDPQNCGACGKDCTAYVASKGLNLAGSCSMGICTVAIWSDTAAPESCESTCARVGMSCGPSEDWTDASYCIGSGVGCGAYYSGPTICFSSSQSIVPSCSAIPLEMVDCIQPMTTMFWKNTHCTCK